MEKLGGRKYLLGLVILVLGGAIDLYTARGLSDNFLYLLMFVFGSYVSGNVFNKKVVGQPVDISIQADEIANKFNELEGKLAQDLGVIAQGIQNVQKLQAATITKNLS